MLRIAIAQVNLLVGDIEGNAKSICQWALHARDELKADVVVFPELALTGYPPEDLLLRPGMYDRVVKALEYIQSQVSDIILLVGCPEKTADGVYNAVAVIGLQPGIHYARKHHLPNYSVFDEKRYFISSDEITVLTIQDIRVGVCICEDIWFKEPVNKLVNEKNAELILNINASPFHQSKLDEREQILTARTSEVKVPIVYVNLVGGQDELVFDGQSFVMDAQGQVCQRLPAFIETIALVEVNKTQKGCEVKPQQDIPALISKEATIYQALVTGVHDYVTKNGFHSVVIGLSGGIDSALTLSIAVDALGAENVEAVMMPTRYTADMSVDDATEQAQRLGVEFKVIPIESTFHTFLNLLEDEFAGKPVDATEENIQARCRGVLLMAISNKKGKMVLTTGNKSEMAVGYATLYGDMAGGFDVLKDVYKTQVYQLANYRNSVSENIPQRVIDRPPSAELAPDQKDSDSLPEYDVLDGILQRYIEQDQSLEAIVAAGYQRVDVMRVLRLVDMNEYKRRQAPPGPRITPRAFGRDRRYPVTSGYARSRK